jgi:ABC-type antimicrobial peptide transport system permease subunit
MRGFHRGFRNFRRNYTRNLVLVLLLFVCLTFSMSMLAVKLAADSQVETIKQSVGNYGEIKVSSTYQMKQFEAERQKTAAERAAEARSMTGAQEFANRVASLVPEKLTDRLAQDTYVKTYDKVLESNVTVPGLTNTNMQQLFQVRENGPQGQNAGPSGSGMNQNSFFFEGNTNGASASDFTTGAKKLVKGKFFTYDDYKNANPVVIIEKNLAKDNSLEVGDTVEAEISGKSGTGSSVDLTVVGIYETVQAEQQSQQSQSSSSQATFNPAGNKFYAPLSVVQKLSATPGYLTLGSYYFDSVDNTAALKVTFKKDAAGTGSKYELATDLSDYQAIADPLLKARNTSVIGMAGALGACALIILLAMFVIVSGRTRELGVLKAIGATDGQVIWQFAAEVLCICLVAIILAMGVTAVVGQSIGNWLLPKSTKTAATTQSAAQASQPPGAPGMSGQNSLYKQGGQGTLASTTQSKQAAKINVVYSGSLFLYGVLILLGISLVGMVIPVLWIVRLRPARVLSME